MISNSSADRLLSACRSNDLETVISLLHQEEENIVDLEIQDEDGYTPLLIVTSLNGRKEIVSLLLSYEANIEARAYGYTSLMYASVHGNYDVMSLLLNAGANMMAQQNGFSSLMVATTSGRSKAMSLLLKHGADIEEKNNSGQTSLHLASSSGHPDAVSLSSWCEY